MCILIHKTLLANSLNFCGDMARAILRVSFFCDNGSGFCKGAGGGSLFGTGDGILLNDFIFKCNWVI